MPAKDSEKSIVVDIREDVPDFLDYIRKRVAEETKALAGRNRAALVKMIVFGFEFGQGNWLALVFDRRKNAKPDGQWSSMNINRLILKRPKWPIWRKLPVGAQVYFVDLAGKQINVMKSPDRLICRIVGDAMKSALLAAREQGVFKKLPKADQCELQVENLEGYYGWPAYQDRGKENLV